MNTTNSPIAQFTEHLTLAKNYAVQTAWSYESALRSFQRWTRQNTSVKAWHEVTRDIIQTYEKHMMAEHYEPATVRLAISALASFFDFMKWKGYITQNPARFVTRPKLPIREPRCISNSTLQAAINDHTIDMETRAFIELIYTTGIRLSEAMAIQRCDINFKERSIKIHGKGNKQRTVYFTSFTEQLIRPFLYSGEFLFNDDARSWRRRVYYALKKHADGIEEQLSPHAIRHTFATNLIDRGMSIRTVSLLLGHNDLKTTMRYITTHTETVRREYNQIMSN